MHQLPKIPGQCDKVAGEVVELLCLQLDQILLYCSGEPCAGRICEDSIGIPAPALGKGPILAPHVEEVAVGVGLGVKGSVPGRDRAFLHKNKLLEPVLDMIVQGFWFHFCIYMFLLLIVDPLLTRKLAGKIRWKELIEDGDDLL